MERLGISIGGKNGKELQREVENFAAAEISHLGVWDKNGNARLERSGSLSLGVDVILWIERRTPDQGTLWQPEMTVSSQYYKAITASRRSGWRPFSLGCARSASSYNTRAMDIHSFLVYRLRNGVPRPVVIEVLSTRCLAAILKT